MNTLGKILVVLNFVFALVVAALLSLKFGTETNWKAGEAQLRDELIISHKANSALNKTARDAQTQLSATIGELEVKKQDIALMQATWAVKEAELQKAYKDAEARGKISETNSDIYQTAMDRMKKEIDALKDVIVDREGKLLAMHAKYKDSQDLAMMLDRENKFNMDRNSNLIKRVQELEVAYNELVSGGKSGTAGALAKDPNAANPPAKYIKGVVEGVDPKDKTLVRVSLGSDHGIIKGHTLEAYRVGGKGGEWVGLIRIEDVYPHESVARLIRMPGSAPREMREGDVVSSTLTPR